MGILDFFRTEGRLAKVSHNVDGELGEMASAGERFEGSPMEEEEKNLSMGEEEEKLSKEDIERHSNASDLRDHIDELATPYPRHFSGRELDRGSVLRCSRSINGKSDAVEYIEAAIRQLDWLKETIHSSHSCDTQYLDGIQSIVECVNGCLEFLSVEEGGFHVGSDLKLKACLAVVQMERDSAKEELRDVVRKNHSLSESLNSTRKHLLAAIPAYFLALETADSLYEEVLEHIERTDWLENEIGAQDLEEDSCLDGHIVRSLRKGGIKTYRQLSTRTEKELLAISGIGQVSLGKIAAEIERLKIPSFSKILSARGKFSHPIVYKPSGTRKNVTFTENTMRWVTREALEFEGWRAPRAISAISGNSEFTTIGGANKLNHHFFGGFTRDFESSEVATRPFFMGRQYDYHFLKLTPLDRMVEKLGSFDHVMPRAHHSVSPIAPSNEAGVAPLNELLSDKLLDVEDADFGVDDQG